METVQALNPLKSLTSIGQSIWLDYIRRDMFASGELAKLIKEDGLRGMTSNPSIFEKAFAGKDYDTSIKELCKTPVESKALYENLAIEDVQAAADFFKPVYDETKRKDGYVSLEVSPHLAFDSQATIIEAQRLWKAVARPNVMIKVPGTKEGILALEALIAEGINVNVTLLFSKNVYEKVAHTFIKGLESFAAKGGDVSTVASVASFFISRIDTSVDQILNDKIKASNDTDEKQLLTSLLGKTAIANAKLTYQLYKQIIKQPNWQTLAKKGAMPQRLLWASTGTKNPKYSDVYYVEELVGPDTVNTIPPATYNAFREHGKVSDTLEAKIGEAEAVISNLEKSGISLETVCAQLVTDGVKLFSDAFDTLFKALETKQASMGSTCATGLKFEPGSASEQAVKKNALSGKEPTK